MTLLIWGHQQILMLLPPSLTPPINQVFTNTKKVTNQNKDLVFDHIPSNIDNHKV